MFATWWQKGFKMRESMGMGKVLLLLVFLFLAFIILGFVFAVSSARGESLSLQDEAKIFPQRVLDLIFKPDPLTDEEIVEIKSSLQARWGSGYNFNSGDKWKAIMSMADDQRKLEILLLWLEVESQEGQKKLLDDSAKNRADIQEIKRLIYEYHNWMIAFTEQYTKALLEAKNQEMDEANKKILALVARIKELEARALESQPKSAPGVPQEEVDRMIADYEAIIKGLQGDLASIQRMFEDIKKELAEARLVPWPEEEEKKEPGNFWVAIGDAAGQKIFPNALGFFADNLVFHTRPWLPVYFEAGARKFLIKNFLAIQAFGAYGSTWFAGAGIVGYVEPLDISVSVGAQYFPEDLIGRLEPIQIFLELTHEGDWTRMSLRVVPQLNLAQLSAGVKF